MQDISTFYIRDAQGNVLAVYEKNGSTITWKEQHLYGSSRLGTVEPAVAWTTTPAATPYFRSTRILNYGWKRYEVNDHLGNVRALINDRKAYNGTTFTATLLDATDYFPFGAEMRKGTVATSYRYGFNGKEQDKNGEFGGLNHYDYGFRIYNPGIGRFLSVDPLTAEYPWYSPYQFAGNGPIANLDVDGKEPISYMSEMKVGSSAINPNWGNYEWMNSYDPKLNQTMTLRHDLNTERWYVWKKTGDPSITGGAVFDPEEYRSSGAWSGRWLEYKTPERVRYEGGIAAAENFEKAVITTMAVSGGLVYVAAAAPLATSAARVAMPHILRGGQWAGNTLKSIGRFLKPDFSMNLASAIGDAAGQLMTNDDWRELNLISIAGEGLLGGKAAFLTTSVIGNTFSLDLTGSYEFAGGAKNYKSTSDRLLHWARNVTIGTAGNGIGEVGGLFTKALSEGILKTGVESGYNFIGDGLGGSVQNTFDRYFNLQKSNSQPTSKQ